MEITKIKNKRFSLIELVIVMAIVFMLISLLQPSLLKMVSSSRLLQCKKNLRDISVPMQMYLEDYAYYPYAVFKTNNKYLYGSWDDLLGQGYDGRNLTFKEMDHPMSKTDNDMYTCYQQEDVAPISNGFVRSYAMNCNQSSQNMGGFSSYWGFGDNPISASVYNVPAPSESILLLEFRGRLGDGYGGAGSYGIGEQKNSFNNNPLLYHDAQFNYLFADNHVELLLPDETRNPNKGNWVQGKYWTRASND